MHFSWNYAFEMAVHVESLIFFRGGGGSFFFLGGGGVNFATNSIVPV